LVQRQRERSRHEPVHFQPIRGFLDPRDVVGDEQVVEPNRRYRIAQRLERQRMVTGSELELSEVDARFALDAGHRAFLNSTQMLSLAASPSGVRRLASR